MQSQQAMQALLQDLHAQAMRTAPSTYVRAHFILHLEFGQLLSSLSRGPYALPTLFKSVPDIVNRQTAHSKSPLHLLFDVDAEGQDALPVSVRPMISRAFDFPLYSRST